jgi:hypothetical protein
MPDHVGNLCGPVPFAKMQHGEAVIHVPHSGGHFCKLEGKKQKNTRQFNAVIFTHLDDQLFWRRRFGRWSLIQSG